MLPNSMDVVYHVAQRPELVARFWALEHSGRGAQIIQEMNGISYALAHGGSATPQQRSRSNAPAPIRPVNGNTTHSAPRITDPDIDYRTYKRLRDEQERRR
jgi:hypothetical protein